MAYYGNHRNAGAIWPSVADDMFRLMHRDADGVALVEGRIAGMCLAAAMFGELLIAGHAAVLHRVALVVCVPDRTNHRLTSSCSGSVAPW
ncbi:hypothetical protein Asp14428_56830 [Actinoplanes sp. NBRC 14428]|uniref:Uncharacterized protein n=1 Tax=Pseudosporangium ferrugineum TaxID=439699 RepID=A0A2T0RDN5_9ACTN|nr:hypothetical protein [Pseudosporangium ferrugineum]PRY19277.1 hypothetical protein CLV70_13640 [Pseudosporangium ferrugineum]BCJ54208.1 hypothetical protein Asp14428_56830 [Actinoplanes sp. NBRC 14428]